MKLPRRNARHRRRTQGPMQQELRFQRKWGGKRKGAGRPKGKSRKAVAHRARPAHHSSHPVHVTLRAAPRLPSLRRQSLFLKVRRALGLASRASFRVVHFSVQVDHLHLVVEAHDRVALARYARGLAIRVARAVNRALQRRGRVFVDRYHARALESPRDVRNTIVYVVQNWRKHLPDARGIDPRSSGWWFTGWRQSPSGVPPDWDDREHAPVMLPRTWLGRDGWRKRGLVDQDERPKLE
jgi:REP element-mobilizing transposase RayT